MAKNGKYLEYYDSGQLKEETDYLNGKLHGKWLLYHESGQLWIECNYIDDKKHGK